MTSISIIANCQGGPLSKIIPYISNCTIRNVFVAHELGADDEERVCDELRKSDIVFAQPFMSTFKLSELRVENISRTLNSKVILAPNIHFEVPFGEPLSLKLANGSQLSDAPSTSYHYKPIVDAYFDGRDAAKAIQFLTDPDWYSITEAENLLSRSLESIERREKYCDIIISDVLIQNFYKSPLMYTMNHPMDFMLYFIAEKFLCAAGIVFTKLNSEYFGTSKVCRSLGEIVLPTNPSIARKLKLPYPADLIYKGISNNGNSIREVTYTPAALVEAYFSTYDAYADQLKREDSASLEKTAASFRLD